MADPFIGTWELDPAQNRYQQGIPPKSGLYIITVQEIGYHISMIWTTQNDQIMEMSYEAIPDGVDYDYKDSIMVDTLSMTRVDHRTLDSDTKKGGKVVAHARRVLSDDGQTMTITQSGTTADGEPFSNVSVYEKQS